jgi:putative thiamine transport system permease protein
MAQAIWSGFKKLMLYVSRALVLFIFFIPLIASLYFFGVSIGSLLGGTQNVFNFWSDYVLHSSLISILVSLLSTFFAVVLAYYIGFCIFTARSNYFQKIISVFLSVPHLAFFSGILFLISSSGVWARLWQFIWPEQFYGLDRDSLGLSFAISLALKESLFLIFVLLPQILNKKNKSELLVTQSLGQSEWSYWTFALWPRLLEFLRYPIWMVIAFSISVVDLAIVMAPTNPPPFSVVLWEFFKGYDPEHQSRSILGSLHIIFLLILVIGIWEALVKLYQIFVRWRLNLKVNSELRVSAFLIFGAYCILQLAPVVVLGLWALADEWVFPSLLPSVYTFNNLISGFESILPRFGVTILIGLCSSLIATSVGLIWLEWDVWASHKNTILPILLVPIFPVLPLIFGFDIFLNSFLRPGPFWSVLYIHIFFVFPYVFILLRNNYGHFDHRLKIVSLNLGKNIFDFFIQVRLPLIFGAVVAAFAVGFAVSVAQYVTTLFLGGGRVETLSTQMVVAAIGENRKWIGVFGMLQILLPSFVFLMAEKLGKVKY